MNRLLHVIRSANPRGGGPIEVVTKLGLEHVQGGRHVEVATLDAPDAPWLHHFPLPIHSIGPVSTKYGYTSRLLPWLHAHASTFDMVIVNGLWQYTSLAVWMALRKGPTPYVVFPHGMLDPWFKQRYPLKHVKKWLYWPWAEYRVLRDATAVLFTSEDERRLARESFWLYECREEVINYGTATPPPETPGERERWFERFPELAGKRALLFLGRIHEKKGCDLLIRAFARAVRSQPACSAPWHLVLAGPASTARYERRLRRLIDAHGIAERVTWTGMLAGDLKWAALRTADAFGLLSHQENFGVAVVEALACGLPVLISTKVNIWREVLGAEAGMAEIDDQMGADRLLARWMTLDEATQSRMREKAARCFAARFDIRDTATQFALLLDRFK
jgi:glycosyltransferase involved in cell wall biosynthesis